MTINLYLRTILRIIALGCLGIGLNAPAMANDDCDPNYKESGYNLFWELNSLDQLHDVFCKLAQNETEIETNFDGMYVSSMTVPEQELFGDLAGKTLNGWGSPFKIFAKDLPLGNLSCDAEITFNVNADETQLIFIATLIAEGRRGAGVADDKTLYNGYIREIVLKCGTDAQTLWDNLKIHFDAIDPNALGEPQLSFYSFQREDGLGAANHTFKGFGNNQYLEILPDIYFPKVAMETYQKYRATN